MISCLISSGSRSFGACGAVILLTLLGHTPGFASGRLEGTNLSYARETLLRDGWQPLETFGTFADGLRWNEDGDAGALYKGGYKEVEACSGTGANYCSFNYVRGGKCLTLHTQGEFEPGKYEPVVIRRSFACPRSEVTAPARAASR